MTEEYVILSNDGFWSGSKWVKEYPEAMIYGSYTKVEQAFTKLESDLRVIDTSDMRVIQDYGTEYEQVVLTSEE